MELNEMVHDVMEKLSRLTDDMDATQDKASALEDRLEGLRSKLDQDDGQLRDSVEDLLERIQSSRSEHEDHTEELFTQMNELRDKVEETIQNVQEKFETAMTSVTQLVQLTSELAAQAQEGDRMAEAEMSEFEARLAQTEAEIKSHLALSVQSFNEIDDDVQRHGQDVDQRSEGLVTHVANVLTPRIQEQTQHFNQTLTSRVGEFESHVDSTFKKLDGHTKQAISQARQLHAREMARIEGSHKDVESGAQNAMKNIESKKGEMQSQFSELEQGVQSTVDGMKDFAGNWRSRADSLG